jgi:hypothetical protein
MRGRVFTFICLIAILGSLAVAGPSFAQSSPAQDVYGNGGVLGVVNGGGPADIVPTPGTANGHGTIPTRTTIPTERGSNTPPATTTGSLPFTGFQAGLVALIGLGLLGGGIAMRRVARD